MNAAEGTLNTYVTKTNEITGSVTSLGSRMNAAEGTLDTYVKKTNEVTGTVTSLGNRMNAAEGTLDTYVSKTNRIDGTLTSIGSRMDAAEKKFTNYVMTETFNGTVSDINATLTRHWSAIEQTDSDLQLSINKASGYPLNKDVHFLKGLNGIARYNNSPGEAVTIKRSGSYCGDYVPDATNYPAVNWTTAAIRYPHVNDLFYNTSNRKWYTYTKSYKWEEITIEIGAISPDDAGIIRIQKIVGNSSPGLGGFTFGTQSRANTVFETRFIAHVPKGYRLNFASNATGNDSRSKWITGNAGTGDWTEYRYQVSCGASGIFSTTNFFYLTKDVSGRSDERRL